MPPRHDAVGLEGLEAAHEVEQQVVVGLPAPDLLDVPLGARPEDEDRDAAALLELRAAGRRRGPRRWAGPVSRSYRRVRSLNHLPRRATSSLCFSLAIRADGLCPVCLRIAPPRRPEQAGPPVRTRPAPAAARSSWRRAIASSVPSTTSTSPCSKRSDGSGHEAALEPVASQPLHGEHRDAVAATAGPPPRW